MFRDLHADYSAFFQHGIGAMCWSFDAEGRRELWFIAPCDAPESKGWEVARIYCERSANDWAKPGPGPVSGWDGNVERPTFNPSIWLRDRKGWHGFIRDGDLHDA